MFGNAHFDQMRQSFADQFSSDGHSYIYRKNQTGVPIRVSELERDDFIAAFNKRVRYAIWSIIVAIVGLCLLVAWLIPDIDSVAGQIAIWGGIIASLSLCLVAFYRTWGAPSRALERRAPEGAALSKEDARALALSKITYGQLALFALIGVGFAWDMSAKVDVPHGWEMAWPVVGVVPVLLAGVQAIRKWRLRRH